MNRKSVPTSLKVLPTRSIFLLLVAMSTSAIAGKAAPSSKPLYSDQCDLLLDTASRLSPQNLREFSLTAQMEQAVAASPHADLIRDLIARANAGMPVLAFRQMSGEQWLADRQNREKALDPALARRHERRSRIVGGLWFLSFVGSTAFKYQNAAVLHHPFVLGYGAGLGLAVYGATKFLPRALKISPSSLEESNEHVRQLTDGSLGSLSEFTGVIGGAVCAAIAAISGAGEPANYLAVDIFTHGILGYISGSSIPCATVPDKNASGKPSAFSKPSPRTLSDILEQTIRYYPGAAEAHYWQEEITVDGKPVRVDNVLILAPSPDGPQILLLVAPDIIP